MNAFPKHPSTFLPESVVAELRKTASEAEGLRQLHPIQLKLIRDHKWLRLFVPKEFDGLEMTLPEILKLEESLARADGSTAWVVTLCAGAAWFVGFFDSKLARELFADKDVFFAGSGMTTGTAEEIDGGFVVNGFWKYASGALHATCFTANCVITKNKKPVLDKGGEPVVRAFVFKRDEVKIHNTWNSMGMVATASHSFEVNNLSLPAKRSFQIDAKAAMISKPMFKYPFLQLAETTLAVNLSGMAMRFIDLNEEMIANKVNPKAAKRISQAKKKLNTQRKEFFRAAEASWKFCVEKSISKTALQKVSNTSHTLAQLSRQLVNDLYPYCGLTAADTNTEVNRVWRNFHTASQHSLFQKSSR